MYCIYFTVLVCCAVIWHMHMHCSVKLNEHLFTGGGGVIDIVDRWRIDDLRHLRYCTIVRIRNERRASGCSTSHHIIYHRPNIRHEEIIPVLRNCERLGNRSHTSEVRSNRLQQRMKITVSLCEPRYWQFQNQNSEWRNRSVVLNWEDFLQGFFGGILGEMLRI